MASHPPPSVPYIWSMSPTPPQYAFVPQRLDGKAPKPYCSPYPEPRSQNYWKSRTKSNIHLYQNCDIKELKSFYTQRQLSVPFTIEHDIRRTASRKLVLINGLLLADKNQTFEKFSDLPAELREIIYTFYFQDLDTNVSERRLENKTPNELARELIPLAQPPLTAVSRAVREETLPIFYKSCTFGFALHSGFIRKYIPGPAGAYSVLVDARSATDYIPTAVLNQVRKLRFIVMVPHDDDPSLVPCLSWWRFDIEPGKTRWDVETRVTALGQGEGPSQSADWKSLYGLKGKRAVQGELEDVLEEEVAQHMDSESKQFRFGGDFVDELTKRISGRAFI